MDIQYVAESSLALAHYVTSYVTKAERSNLQSIWQEVSENRSIYSRLWSFGVRSLRTRECGLYEASDLLLGDHTCEKSASVKWVDASVPEKRGRRLRNYSALKSLAEQNPQSLEIYEDNMLDTYYPQRPKQLKHVCLYDFIAHYEFAGVKDGERDYWKVNKSCLPNHRLYNPNKDTEVKDCYYSLLLLFVPFRNENDLLEVSEPPQQAFNRLLPSSSSGRVHHVKLQKMLDAQQKVEEINRVRLNEVEAVEDDEPQLPGEAKSAVQDIADISIQPDTGIPLDQREAMLNADEKRVYDKVKTHLIHQREHELGDCQCTYKPMHLFVSGVGGTGKSFLINVIRALVSSIWQCKGATCAVGAPTGLASFNIRGLTVHMLFLLPIEHEGKAATYWPLGKVSQKRLRFAFRHLKLIVIDEISMVSSLNLAYIHLRLDEIFRGPEWFGSQNLLVVGDLLQLQPVNGKSVFVGITQKAILLKLGCTTSLNIWRETMSYDELTINERQKIDPSFATTLNNVRIGCPTEHTLETLKQRLIDIPVHDKFLVLQRENHTPVCLFTTRKACHDFNNTLLKELNSKIHELPCIDAIDETMTISKWNKKAAEHLEKLNKDSNMTGGLESKLTLAVGARVMLRRNIDVHSGLVNGVVGTVLAITNKYVTVQFDHASKTCPIERVSSRFIIAKNLYVVRSQFPLILAYAITIHKCQGLSLETAIIDLSEKVFAPGMAYVALSRVKSLAGLHLSAFDPKSIIVSRNGLIEVNRLRQMCRPDLPLYTIPSLSSKTRKRKLTGTVKGFENDQPSKRSCLDHRTNHKPSTKGESKQPNNTSRDNILVHSDIIAESTQQQIWPFSYNPVTELWQHNACTKLGIQFARPLRVQTGDFHVPLTLPNLGTQFKVKGDGNCLFRCLSYIVTGREDRYTMIRAAILRHMINIGHLLLGSLIDSRYTSIQDYIQNTAMNRDGTWGTNVEMHTFAHLMNVNVFSFVVEHRDWFQYSPSDLDPITTDEVTRMGVYLAHDHDHYNVIASIL